MPSAPTEPQAPASECSRTLSVELQQLARAVRSGQRVTAYLSNQEAVTGYLAGIDDTTWFILDPDPQAERVRRWLIPRQGRVLEIHGKPTYGAEPERFRREMEKIIVHLRTWFRHNAQID